MRQRQERAGKPVSMFGSDRDLPKHSRLGFDVTLALGAASAGRLLGDDWLTRMNESGRRIHGPTA